MAEGQALETRGTHGRVPAAPCEPSRAVSAERAYRGQRIAHWDALADGARRWWNLGGHYHKRLAAVYRFLVPPGQKVLELGCQEGDLLAAVEPSEGVGVDFSPRMIARAARRHPELRFVLADAHELDLGETFDVIILSDLVNDLWDVQRVFQKVRRHAAPHTRIMLNTYSRLWQLPLTAARALRLATPMMVQNWLTVEDLSNLLNLEDLEVVSHWSEILFPLGIPLLAGLCNRFLVKLWPFRFAALTNFVVARPQPRSAPQDAPPVVSVVVPARNEAGHIEEILRRTPEMGAGTEVIFVEGGSTDDTWGAIRKALAAHPERQGKALRQTGVGKGDAVRLGFANASGDVLMILDADMTVPPEDLPRFYEALRCGKAEFVNGVRLVYPMEKRAMRFCNLMGNKFFSLVFSWLLNQNIKDTLCGTKVLSRTNYERIAAGRDYFGDFDPFGDFDLIFGAARLHLKIVDLPIRYRDRIYGDTNISRWKHGRLLLRMAAFAATRIKFI